MAGASDPTDLDGLVRRVDPDRWLSSRFVADPQARADVIALYAFDHELARAPKVASNPLLGEIRLTWWREVLDEVFEGRAVRRHPTAEALAQAVARGGFARDGLEAIIDARYRELDPQPMTPDEAEAWARDTAGAAAVLAAQRLDPEGEPAHARDAGAAWGLSRRVVQTPALRGVFDALLQTGRTEAHRLGVRAFPAVAHAALARARAEGRSAGGVTERLSLTLAVARGRI